MLLFSPVLPSVASPFQAPIKPLPLLSRASDIRQLTSDEAKRGYPVHLHSVVTYYDPGSDLFLQDSSAGIWVEMGGAHPALQPGDLVDLEGVTSFADFAPQVAEPRIKVIGKTPLPKAQAVSYEQLASGAEDSQWVAVEGIVRQANMDDGQLSMMVALAGGKINARAQGFHEVPATLIDAKVRLQGACGAIFNSRGQLTGVVLNVPGPGQVSVEEPGLTDAFYLPVRPISSLLGFAPNGVSGHRVRVQGVVTSQIRGKALFIQDSTEGLYVGSPQDTPVEPGDLVDVVGFPALGDYTPILEDASFRRLGTAPEPRPVVVTGDEALQGDVDSQLIRIDARLRDKVSLTGETDLVLQSGNIVFDAQIFGAGNATGAQDFARGELLRLTGVCTIKVDESRTPRAFRVVLRSPRDVGVLERPPWITAGRAASVAGLLLIATLLAVLGMAVLRRRVEERTEALKRRSAELERSNAELEQFANVASHDLQEPLRMVAIFGQLLADRYRGKLDSDADAYLGFLVEGAHRMRALIDGLLTFSRVQSKARELEATDTEEVLRNALADLTVTIEQSAAAVTHDPLPVVMADSSQLEQLLQNLIANAVKFAADGPPRIHVSADRVGEQWVFSVRDNGIGIDPRYHDKIFGIFQRLHSRETYPGTGIGLSVCKRIVERHGGRIWVESAEGQGSTFYFSVPAARAYQAQTRASRPAVPSREPPQPQLELKG
ncbi:MAG TPA: ATP-binding protein [Terriglobia bacterium]|nr:ATP-binding protein [Terriglobia bacterium]